MYSSLYLESSENKIQCSSNKSTRPNHWSNIPSGLEYKENLEKKYPGMRSSPYKSDYEKSFPYERLRPAPQKLASNLLLYSNEKIYSQNTPRNANCLQNSPNTSRVYNQSNEDRIKKALKHINNASKILESN